MPFDGGKRFTDAGSQFDGNATHGTQDVFFMRGLNLLPINDVPRAAILCLQPYYILGPQASDRAFDEGGTCSPFTDVECEFGRQPSIRALVHQPKRTSDSLIRDKT